MGQIKTGLGGGLIGYTGVLVLHVLSGLTVPPVLLRTVSPVYSARTARAAVVHVMTALQVRFCKEYFFATSAFSS